MQEMDFELERWQRHWRTQETVPPDLANAVESGTRKMRRGVFAEIVVTMIMGGGALGWAVVSRRPDVIVLAIAVWFFIAIAQTRKFACRSLIALAMSAARVVLSAMTRSSPRPYITTSASVAGFTSLTSLIHRRTAC